MAREVANRMIGMFTQGRGRPAAHLRRHREVPAGSALARPAALQRVLPRRQRRGPRRQPSDRMDRTGGQSDRRVAAVSVARCIVGAAVACCDVPTASAPTITDHKDRSDRQRRRSACALCVRRAGASRRGRSRCRNSGRRARRSRAWSSTSAGAACRAWTSCCARARARSRATLTSGDGIFRFLDVAPGEYTHRAHARGLRAADAARTARVGRRSSSRVDLKLASTATAHRTPASHAADRSGTADAVRHRRASRSRPGERPPCRSRRTRRSSCRCPIAGTCRCPSGIATARAATIRTYSGHWWDPYNQNRLKGDYPVIGKRTFFTFTGISDSLLEGRNLPVPAGVSTRASGQRAVLRPRRHLRAADVGPDVVRSVPRRHGVPPDRLARPRRAGVQRQLRQPRGIRQRQRRRAPQATRGSTPTSASRKRSSRRSCSTSARTTTSCRCAPASRSSPPTSAASSRCSRRRASACSAR